jgi:ABC-2 type transport system ATP-binding protein
MSSDKTESGTLAVETRGLTRHYGQLVAVDHLNLAVRRGELLAFLGPNGAGKTTTIRMLAGLIQPTEGQALIDGLDVTDHPLEIKRRIGVVPQRSNLYGELTARENLLFTAKLYGLPRNQRQGRVDELLAQFALTDKANTSFAALSGGMKRRLTIAAALIHRPSILFLDEPTTGLDVQSARQLRAMIADLRQQGVTIFLTTHLIQEAERLADRVAIIVKGKLIAVDTPQALCARCQDEIALEITVAEPASELLTMLSNSPAITSIFRSGDTLRLAVASLDDALREVTAITQSLHIPIQAIRTAQPSLEDAFVRITSLDVESMRNGAAGNQKGGQG